MATIQQSSNQHKFKEILQELADLQLADLEQFVKQATKLLERKKSPKFIKKEKELIDKIKSGGPGSEIVNRQNELLKKSVEGLMSEAENKESLRLIPIFDAWTLERFQLMTELAGLWDTDVDKVMDKLNIKAPVTVYA